MKGDASQLQAQIYQLRHQRVRRVRRGRQDSLATGHKCSKHKHMAPSHNKPTLEPCKVLVAASQESTSRYQIHNKELSSFSSADPCSKCGDTEKFARL